MRKKSALPLALLLALAQLTALVTPVQASPVTYTYTYEFTEYPPPSWALVYSVWGSYTDYPTSMGVSPDGLYVEDGSTSIDVRLVFTYALPHANQSYTAEVWFKPNVTDVSKDFKVTIAVGGDQTATKMYVAGYASLDATLKVWYYDYPNSAVNTVATGTGTYTLSNNQWYRLWVNVTWTGSGITVTVELRNATGTTLLNLAGVELSGVYPIVGVGIWMGSGQVGKIYVKNATITFSGEPNLPEMKPILDPDYLTYDWVGAPSRVFFQHSDGKFYPYAENGTVYVTVRWHGESSGTGDKIDLYKIVGDPRERGNWHLVKTIVTRSQLGWSRLEECNLIILNNGTWVAFVTGGSTWAVHRFVSNDGGSTWTDEGAIINGKENHIWVEENGTIFMSWWNMSAPGVHISRSDDLGKTWNEISQLPDYRMASILKYNGVYYILASKVVESDSANYVRWRVDLYKSVDMRNFDFDRTVLVPYPETPFTLYMNGMKYQEVLLYRTKTADYIIMVGEQFVVDHDANDDFNDQTQKHLVAVAEPIMSFLKKVLVLPKETAYLTHEIAYSPNSTQFDHSFTTTNATTAGYETNYVDAYGWRVYVNPYQSGGVSYKNIASLVSEVNVSLPYASVFVENVTLLVRSNSTGDLRQLWIKVMNSTGDIVAEVSNASMGVDWTEVVIPVNTNLSGRLALWMNATVASTNATGEEIDVRDVRIFVKYDANLEFSAAWEPNIDFNCSASHYVELGSREMLNRSTIRFKLIEFLIYNTTDYPVQPVYVGNETIDSYTYSVYRVDPANYEQNMTIYALLRNWLRSIRARVRGYDTDTALVGEPVTIELPVEGNITMPDLGISYTNTTSIIYTFDEAGNYTIVANLTQAALWKYGLARLVLRIKLGSIVVKPLDVDSRVVDYENLTAKVYNGTAPFLEEIVNGVTQISGLPAGNYTVHLFFKNVEVGVLTYELNTTTDGLEVNVSCAVKRLSRDYRGYNRSLVYGLGRQLLEVRDLSAEFPLSKMSILLNGSGSFKLYINYGGSPPSKVDVVGNVTNLSYYWDGNYLAISGSLGSVGEINVSDLYRLRIELYDRLGNLMPLALEVHVNETKYVGRVVEDFFSPGIYIITLPARAGGFDFFSFTDGYGNTVREVLVNTSDVTMRAWYRVPTEIVDLGTEYAFAEGAYITGLLRDYYKHGVAGRKISVTVRGVGTVTTTTDATGRFRAGPFSLEEGEYAVFVTFAGDDIYVETEKEARVRVEKLVPTLLLKILWWLLLLAVVVIVMAVASAARKVALERRGRGYWERG